LHEINIYRRYTTERLKVFPTETGDRNHAFAQKLGRLSRGYAYKSRQMAAANQIYLHEAKSLDGATLRAIAAPLSGVNISS
jgi:hypothetical protein